MVEILNSRNDEIAELHKLSLEINLLISAYRKIYYYQQGVNDY